MFCQKLLVERFVMEEECTTELITSTNLFYERIEKRYNSAVCLFAMTCNYFVPLECNCRCVNLSICRCPAKDCWWKDLCWKTHGQPTGMCHWFHGNKRLMLLSNRIWMFHGDRQMWGPRPSPVIWQCTSNSRGLVYWMACKLEDSHT